MNSKRLDTIKAMRSAHDEALRLLDGGDAAGAITFVETLDAGPKLGVQLRQLRATMYTDGGHQLKRRDLVERGAVLWQQLNPDADSAIAYNLANAEMAIYELSFEQGGFPAAWERDRSHLHEARKHFDRVGKDENAPKQLRLQALTNAANSYDIVGRDLDALEIYDEALRLEPAFGMALGNRGIMLAHVAPFMGAHANITIHEAVLALDAAVKHKGSVLAFGGPAALEYFQNQRTRLPSLRPPAPSAKRAPWTDRHLAWCYEHRLFLHVSHDCLHTHTKNLDAIFFHSLISDITPEDRAHVYDLVDAFNTIKQDFITARYLTWLATAPKNPIRKHAQSVSGRVSFLDTLSYARWGVRTGIATQALAAAVDVLDKIAGFIHLYFQSNRLKDVYFRSIAWEKRGSRVIAPQLAAALSKPEGNRGLMALCDLSADVEKPTPLSHHLQRRHAATHRFLVTHTEIAPAPSDWIDHVKWDDLIDESVEQLRISRGAILYLARTIDVHEERKHGATPSNKLTIHMPITRADTDLAEYE